MSMCTILDKVH